MEPLENRKELLKIVTRVLALAVTINLVLIANITLAKGKGGKDNRSEFYGIVQERPENTLYGKWVIDGHTVVVDKGTEFNQHEGQLTVGSCAKVHIRNGRVHEIDSEPANDCQ